MKNEAIASEASRRSEAWGDALRRFDRELQRRGAAERTRRAYGADARRAGRSGRPRRACARTTSATRSCAAGRRACPPAGAAPRTLARKLASARAFFRVLVEHGELRANPADLLASPKLPQRLPRTLKADEVAAAAGPDPRHDAAGAARPRHVRARLRLRPARRGARQPRPGSSSSTPSSCACSARAPRRASCPSGSPRCAPWRATSSAAAAALAGDAGRAGAVPLQDRPAALDVRRPAPPAGLGAPCGALGRGAIDTHAGTR